MLDDVDGDVAGALLRFLTWRGVAMLLTWTGKCLSPCSPPPPPPSRGKWRGVAKNRDPE
jgi:hypothetical protein